MVKWILLVTSIYLFAMWYVMIYNPVHYRETEEIPETKAHFIFYYFAILIMSLSFFYYLLTAVSKRQADESIILYPLSVLIVIRVLLAMLT